MASSVSIRTAVAAPLPEVDDHLVEPGTPYEMWDGELVYVPPCDAPHGTRQSTLSALLEFHVAPGFAVVVGFSCCVIVTPLLPAAETTSRRPHLREAARYSRTRAAGRGLYRHDSPPNRGNLRLGQDL